MAYVVKDTQRVPLTVPTSGTVEFWVIVASERVARVIPEYSVPLPSTEYKQSQIMLAFAEAARIKSEYRAGTTSILRVEVVS